VEKYNSWVEYDVALEIIGKMIAEQVEGLNKLLDLFEGLGFSINESVVVNDKDYKQYVQRIRELNAEIDKIYRDENLVELLQKVQNVYAPYLKAKFTLSRNQTIKEL
jgi:ABC-type phosphate/phosphonate transport system ATPase subunit